MGRTNTKSTVSHRQNNEQTSYSDKVIIVLMPTYVCSLVSELPLALASFLACFSSVLAKANCSFLASICVEEIWTEIFLVSFKMSLSRLHGYSQHLHFNTMRR